MKRVLIIQTGGTILMQTDLRHPGSVSTDPSLAKGYLLREVPEIKRIADIEVMEFLYEDSSNLCPANWEALTAMLFEYYNDFDGFVILHGTDTMSYTASAVSFALRPLRKPVIFTGSQVPLTNLRSDARRNLINSVEIATMAIPEVAVCFNDKLYRGNRSTKMSIGDFDAFNSPNLRPLAEIGLNIEVGKHILQPPSGHIENSAAFDSNVYILKLFPGLKTSLLEPLFNANIRAILIEGFGSGNFPSKGEFDLTPFFEACVQKDIVMAMCSQAPYDAIDLTKYASGRIALELGIISSETMTVEASVTKLMYLLGHHNESASVRNGYTQNLAGEI